jgi:hypothetical protein
MSVERKMEIGIQDGELQVTYTQTLTKTIPEMLAEKRMISVILADAFLEKEPMFEATKAVMREADPARCTHVAVAKAPVEANMNALFLSGVECND